MRKTHTKGTAEYYLNLDYPITLEKLSEEDGGGYAAYIPQLGSGTFVAVGESQAQALESLEELRQHLIPRLVERGVKIPEPRLEHEPSEHYSGSLMLRVPPVLHAQLVAAARLNGCSINKLATQFLAQALE